MDQIIVTRHRTTKVQLSLPYDVTGDTISSEIREDDDPESTLLATWDVSLVSAEAGHSELVLTIDSAAANQVEKELGYMDLKRLSGGEPLNVFDGVLEVLFKDPVTA